MGEVVFVIVVPLQLKVYLRHLVSTILTCTLILKIFYYSCMNYRIYKSKIYSTQLQEVRAIDLAGPVVSPPFSLHKLSS